MTKILIEKLKTGEPACKVGVSVYALVPVEGIGTVIMDRYHPYDDPLNTLESGKFSKNYRKGNSHSTYDEFIAMVEEIQLNLDQKSEIGRFTESCQTATKWGKAQTVERYSRGINLYSTASHGGFKLSAKANEQVPEYLRTHDGCYEEDQDWCIVAITFPQFFTDYELKNAKNTFLNGYPDEYEKFYGVTILPGESYVRDEQIFKENHKNDFVVISAVRSDVHEGMVETWATRGGERQMFNGPSVEEKRFLVPMEEYGTRNNYGFVIDLEKHKEMTPEATHSMSPGM